ncbi:protein sey1 [Lentinula edodes]|uniref:Protein sey1 n=1 Tax=Lentinula edodes TaxID=5353 RepID=A0A1Q3ERF8_LENED|nr:protein sey1 [Lentinula edodes]
MASASIGASGNALASPMTNGHSPLSERIQIINDQKQFTSELTSQIERWDLRDAGFNYNIVAVFGSQSTGKSTLLNRLFGTTFDVMDETKRQQTTKGIWMCRGKDMNIMVMDVEGTDGRERGEDQDFERKSALFSLASSEVLIINLWEHQVGLYQGANMGLLKTVFEVNLGLFGGKKAQDGTNGRTLLLFVIRDHIGTTPLANLQATLTADLQRIWDSLSKPDELKDRQLTDYFDLDFTALPHKILATDQFELETRNLRGRFPMAWRSTWRTYGNKSKATKISTFRPSKSSLHNSLGIKLSAVALTEFNEQAKPQKRPIEAGKVVEGLGAMMRSWRTVALERYDRDASRYHQGVYKRKRADLIVSLDATLSPLFLGQLKNLHKACLGAFKKDILEGMKGEEYNFADVVSKAKAKCDNRFTTGARESVVDDSEEGKTEWNWEEELELLREEVQSVADQCRKDETKKMVNTIERNFKKQISEPIELALNKGSPNMWDEVLKAFRQTLDKAESTYLIKATSFNCTEEENTYSLAALRRRAWQALRSKIDEQTADSVFVGRLRAHFEERFRYDEQGVPRVWKPEDDIDGIPPWRTFFLRMPSPLFSETKALDLAAKFRKDADLAYVEAKRSTVSSVAQIPFWMYGVLLVLGWNEFMMVLFNPIYFMFLLMAAAAAYLIIQLGLAGPLLSITQTMGLEIKRQATQKLREHFSEPMLAQAQAHNARSQSSSMIEEEDYELRKRQEGSPM